MFETKKRHTSHFMWQQFQCIIKLSSAEFLKENWQINGYWTSPTPFCICIKKKQKKKQMHTRHKHWMNTIHRDSELLALQCSHCIYYCCALQQGESWPFSLLSSLIVNLIYWKYQSAACRGQDAAAAISTMCIYCPLEVKICNFSQNCINQGCFNHKSAHPSCIFLG